MVRTAIPTDEIRAVLTERHSEILSRINRTNQDIQPMFYNRLAGRLSEIKIIANRLGVDL